MEKISAIVTGGDWAPDDCDPLQDIIEFIEELEGHVGYPQEMRESEGYCFLCRRPVTVYMPVDHVRGKQYIGNRQCGKCSVSWPFVRFKTEIGEGLWRKLAPS